MGSFVDSTAEDRISELEGISKEASKVEKQRGKKICKTQSRISKNCEETTKSVTGNLEREEWVKGTEEIYATIMTEISSKFMSDTKPQIKEAQRPWVRPCQENKKSSHRREEHFFTRHIWQRAAIQNTQRTLRSQQSGWWEGEPERHLTQGDTQLADKHMQGCATLYVISGCKLNKTPRHTY